jgi:hypothetical protein
LTNVISADIPYKVIRLRRFITVLLVAVWIPLQCPWAGGLAMLAHEANEAHEASLSWAHGHLHVVLHHARTSSAHHAHAFPEGIACGSAAHSEDTDHVLHPFTSDQFLRASASGISVGAPLCSALACLQYPTLPEQSSTSWRAPAPPRSSPTLDSLRTTILLV